jgi:2-dehydro-3-deoxygluconokinase
VSVVPDTEIGEVCINFIRQFGVNTDFVLRGGRRLGTVYLETGASQRPSKVIYNRAGDARLTTSYAAFVAAIVGAESAVPLPAGRIRGASV